MYRRLYKLAVLTVLAAPIAAYAQNEQNATDDSTIVVTGSRSTDREVLDFVGALTATPTAGSQLSRFETRAACPAIVGVSRTQADTVVSRMRRVAASAGVPLASGNCKANVLVIVTSEKKAFVEALARRYPYYLGTLTRQEVRRIADEPGPAAAWQLAGPQLNADGVEMNSDPDSGTYVNQTTRAGSRIAAGARPQFAAAVVVVESDALVGLTTIQLADYATMRAFTRIDPSKLKGSTVPSIVKLLDVPMGSSVPVTLTGWDLGFLRALYASPVNLPAAAQRSSIAETLKRDVGGDRQK